MSTPNENTASTTTTATEIPMTASAETTTPTPTTTTTAAATDGTQKKDQQATPAAAADEGRVYVFRYIPAPTIPSLQQIVAMTIKSRLEKQPSFFETYQISEEMKKAAIQGRDRVQMTISVASQLALEIEGFEITPTKEVGGGGSNADVVVVSWNVPAFRRLPSADEMAALASRRSSSVRALLSDGVATEEHRIAAHIIHSASFGRTKVETSYMKPETVTALTKEGYDVKNPYSDDPDLCTSVVSWEKNNVFF